MLLCYIMLCYDIIPRLGKSRHVMLYLSRPAVSVMPKYIFVLSRRVM